MKSYLFSWFIFLSLFAHSQITLDFECQLYFLQDVKLSDTETKYFDNNQSQILSLNQFSLYNLDGSLFKTIVLPPRPTPTAGLQVAYISRTLFDNDPNNIEFIVKYWYDSVPNMQYQRTKIIREDGTVLFDEMNGTYPDIFVTEQGTKLRLLYLYATGYWHNLKFFSLPGTLPTVMDESNEVYNASLSLYPNPNNGSFYIKFHSNKEKGNIIELYTLTGKLLDTYRSMDDLIQITDYGLKEGTYLLKSQFNGNTTVSKMIINK